MRGLVRALALLILSFAGIATLSNRVDAAQTLSLAPSSGPASSSTQFTLLNGGGLFTGIGSEGDLVVIEWDPFLPSSQQLTSFIMAGWNSLQAGIVQVPSGASPGVHQVRAYCPSPYSTHQPCFTGAFTTFTVTAPPSPSPTQASPVPTVPVFIPPPIDLPGPTTTPPLKPELAKGCPAAPTLSRTATNLVVLVHGWNGAAQSSSDIFVQMKDDIDAKVGSDWDVVAYDWKEWSNFFPNFTKDRRDLTNFLAPSYSLARHVGKDCLGKLLAQYKNYKFVHFVSHSLGAWVINEAGQVVRNASPDTQIHMTFLDAYVPPQMVGRDGLGKVADWSEQYVDMDGLKNTRIAGIDPKLLEGGYKPYTDQMLKGVGCNINVTGLKTDPLEPAHGWPVMWFKATIGSPTSSGWGFPATKEASGEFPHHPSCSGGKVDLGTIGMPGPDYRSRFKLPPDISLKGPIQLNSFSKGPTGTTSNGNQTLVSGSPVWITGNVQSAAGDNALSIEYRVSGGDCVLEVLLDDAPAWFVTYTGGELSLDDTIIDLGSIPAGSHTLTIQLDPMGDQKSTVNISSIRFASVQLGGDEPDPPTASPSVTTTVPAPSVSPAPSGTRAPLPPNTGSGAASDKERPTTVVIVGLLILAAGAAGATLSRRRRL